MSTALAVAAVTQALKNLLADGVLDNHVAGALGDVVVTALPPDRVAVEGTSAKSQLNLFLYQVSENAYQRNQALPSRSSAGTRLTNPPMALDLHYLLMAYGVKELHSEILLGYGMQVLHETPQLSRDGIRLALTGVTASTPDIPPQLKTIADSRLADQVELVKLTPEVLSTEEISRLWTAFGAKYRTSAAYVASCVLIARTDPAVVPKPVTQPQLKVVPLQRPLLLAVTPSFATVGDTLTITGSQLWQPDGTTVSVSGIDAALVGAPNAETIQAQVPAATRAGVNTIQIKQAFDFDNGKRVGPQSNVLAFMVTPAVGAHPATIARGQLLTITVTPPVGFDQDAQILLGEMALEVPTRTAPPNGPATTNQLTVVVPSTFAAGTALLRVRIDGAESSLGPAGGPFTTPSIQVT